MYSKKSIKEFFKSTDFKICGDRYFMNENNDLSTNFDGDWLVFAENYRACLIIESSELGLTVNTSPNAKCRMVMKLTTPIVKELKNPCGRCDGSGYVPYRHIKNGICFKCNGTGKKKD